MSRLFTDNAGKLGVVASPGLPAVVDIEGASFDGVLVQTIGISQRASVQIQPSLRRSIYIYSFGDAMGSLQIGGAAFIGRKCRTGGGSRAVNGIRETLEFYAKKRVSRTLSHVNVTIGGETFSGFLLSIQVNNREVQHRLFTWTMSLAVLPNFDGMNASRGGDGSSSDSSSSTVSSGTTIYSGSDQSGRSFKAASYGGMKTMMTADG